MDAPAEEEEAPIAPPSTLKPTAYRARKGSLGGDFVAVGPGATRSQMSTASGTSQLSAVQKAARLATKVTRLAEEKLPDAWNKLQEEFEVQKLIWQSVGMVKGKVWVQGLSSPQSMLEGALQDRKATSAQTVLDKGDPSGEYYSNAMRKSLSDIVSQERARKDRSLLAERLRLAAVRSELAHDEEERKELEALVVGARLGDERLERMVRKAFLLPVVELGAPVGAKKTSSAGLGAIIGARAMNGSVGTPVSVAALSTSLGTMTTGPSPSLPRKPVVESPNPSGRSVLLTTSGGGRADAGLGAPVGAKKTSSKTSNKQKRPSQRSSAQLKLQQPPPQPEVQQQQQQQTAAAARVPSTPQVQSVDNMMF